MAAFTKLYPDMSQLIGSGQYKKVYSATNIKGRNDESIGIESDESPKNVVVAVCETSIFKGIIGSRIIDEIILQNEFSRKTPQLAPYIYGVVVKTLAGNITTYVGEDLVKGENPSNINNITKALSRGDMIYIYQQRCDSDLNVHIKSNLRDIYSPESGHNPERRASDANDFITDIHISIKSLFDNIVKSGYFGVDIKSANICHFNGKVDLYGIDSAEPVNIGLDMDPAFTYPFEKKLREATPPIDDLEKITSDFSKHATIFMLIEYYVVFTYMHTQHTGIVSELLTEDGINCAKISEMLKFMKEMEKSQYGNIFQYENERFTPIFMLKHYLSYNLKNEIAQNIINRMRVEGKTVSKDDITQIMEDAYNEATFKLDRMTLGELATKICESLGLPLNPNVGVFAFNTSASNGNIKSIKRGGSRRRRPRKMNSRKKHLNKRTHKTINARTSKSNSK